ncbi:MAG: hypothetical protein ACRCXZ_09795 [Patescibacteria group bacterium]
MNLLKSQQNNSKYAREDKPIINKEQYRYILMLQMMDSTLCSYFNTTYEYMVENQGVK